MRYIAITFKDNNDFLFDYIMAAYTLHSQTYLFLKIIAE